MRQPHDTHAHSTTSTTPTDYSEVISSLFIHAHSSPLPWLSGYTDVVQTLLVILTMAVLFPDRPHIYQNFVSRIPVDEHLFFFPIFFCHEKGYSEYWYTHLFIDI